MVWLPKTAGTSIWRACQKHFGGRWVNPKLDGHGVDVSTVPFVTFEHAGIPALLDMGFLTEEELRSRFVFSVIRNPWDRIVSCAAYDVRRSPSKTIAGVLETYRERLLRHQRRPLLAWGCRKLNPYVDWLTDYDGQNIVHVVCRFENLSEHWAELCRMLDWPEIRLKRYNESPHDHYFKYFDHDYEFRELVGRYYAEDIVLGGYRYDEPAISDKMIVL
jgi:hypothetical protein